MNQLIAFIIAMQKYDSDSRGENLADY